MKILETERLTLRHFVLEDLPELYALYFNPVVRRFFPEGTLSLDEAREELEWFLHGHPRHPKPGLWATIYKPIGQFIHPELCLRNLKFISPDLPDRRR